jgi:hypothetical protein
MIKYLLIVYLTLGTYTAQGQNLFDINTIRTIDIQFYDNNWDALLDSLATDNIGTGSGSGRILANVIIDGIQFDSCGVRYKGNSSMDTASSKNPFNIDLNYVISGQDYMGKDKIKLANCFTDPSMVREALMYELSNQYMDCPGASFVKLYINGGYRGIYTSTESIDNEFLDTYYGSSDNAFFKCDPISFQIYGDNSNLAFHPDTMAYDTLYDMKSDAGLLELQQLCLQLEFNASNIEQYLDVDRALWFLALSNAFVHNDGYTAFAHNYYVYKMDNGKWSIILWDVNMSFGGLLWNGTNLLPLNLQALQNQSPFLHENAVNYRPLIARLLSQPEIKKKYIAHFKTIIEENLDNNHYYSRAQFMQTLIDSDVQNEPFSAYTYADFTTNLDNDVGAWIDLRPGLSNLMTARTAYLNSLPEFQLVAPIIQSVQPSNVQPLAFSTITINVTTNMAVGCDLYYRHHHFDAFEKLPMYDDGAHNDGMANDNIYGLDIAITDTPLEYYIYAQNQDAGIFSPARAAYEFYTINPSKGIVINEILADNASVQSDQDGEYDDWIELYNNSIVPIDMSGYYLSDNSGDITKWEFPAGTTIGSNDYLIIWADKDSLQAGLHSNFKLSANGESVILSNNSGNIIDSTSFQSQQVDVSYGRLANGTGHYTYLLPSFAAFNEKEVYLAAEKTPNTAFELFPNPAINAVTIVTDQPLNLLVEIISLDGKIMYKEPLLNTKNNLDINFLSKGIYLVRIGNTVKKLTVL